MKFILLFLVISLISKTQGSINAEGDTCMGCIEEGGKCRKVYVDLGNIILYEDIGICSGDKICGPPSFEGDIKDELKWICRDRVEIDQPCKADDFDGEDFCKIGLMCEETTKTCLNARFLLLGENCTKSTDCLNPSATCTNGICTSDSCARDYECSYDGYCEDKKCVPKATAGEACEETYECSDNLVCEQKCLQQTYLGLGGKCMSLDFPCDFNQNLYCSMDSGICEKYIEPNPTGNCSATKDSCGFYGKCSCSDGKCYKNYPVPMDYAEFFTELDQCMVEYKCTKNGNFHSKDSCISKNCKDQYCTQLRLAGNDFNSQCNDNYLYEAYCNFSKSKFNFSILLILLITIISILI